MTALSVYWVYWKNGAVSKESAKSVEYLKAHPFLSTKILRIVEVGA
jgi:hypothetical protein